jgi:hypothetical protein
VAVADTVTTAGTVTGPTGSVKGVSYAGLSDAYTGNYGGSVATVSPQWQHAVLLSDTTGACGRSGAGEPYAANEVTLRFTLVGYDNTAGQLPPVQPPAADLPLSFPATGMWVTTSDGVQRQLKAYAKKAKSNGAAGSDLLATGGTVTFTRMDPGPGSYEGRLVSGRSRRSARRPARLPRPAGRSSDSATRMVSGSSVSCVRTSRSRARCPPPGPASRPHRQPGSRRPGTWSVMRLSSPSSTLELALVCRGRHVGAALGDIQRLDVEPGLQLHHGLGVSGQRSGRHGGSVSRPIRGDPPLARGDRERVAALGAYPREDEGTPKAPLPRASGTTLAH